MTVDSNEGEIALYGGRSEIELLEIVKAREDEYV